MQNQKRDSVLRVCNFLRVIHVAAHFKVKCRVLTVHAWQVMSCAAEICKPHFVEAKMRRQCYFYCKDALEWRMRLPQL